VPAENNTNRPTLGGITETGWNEQFSFKPGSQDA